MGSDGKLRHETFSYKEWFVFSHTSVGRSLSGFVVAATATAPGGRLSGWELTH